MGQIKRNVKSLLTRRVQFGLLSVPVWVVGAVFAVRAIRDRRRRQLPA